MSGPCLVLIELFCAVVQALAASKRLLLGHRNANILLALDRLVWQLL